MIGILGWIEFDAESWLWNDMIKEKGRKRQCYFINGL
jgi:hypothetical protein